MSDLSERFHLHRFHPGNDRTGLWLHGWMGKGTEGEALAQLLGYTLICPDLPGHGQTPLGDWTLKRVVEQIAELALETAWVGGYSMGARLVMMSAAAYPEAFGPLVLESGFWGYASPEERTQRRETDRQRARDLKEQGLKAFTDHWYQLPMWGGYVPPARTGKETELAEALQRFSSGHQPDLQPWLRGASSRVLWLAGTRDSAYALRADWVRQHTPHQVRLLDTGHNLHGENPKAWAETVRTFLNTPQTEQE